MESDPTNPWAHLIHTRISERSAVETLDAYRERIAQDIQRLETALQRAREIHNANTPFLSLPDELILDILLRVRDALTGDILDLKAKKPDRLWNITVMICRRFRCIVLNSPSFYTQLSNVTHGMDFLDLSFTRSNPLPLRLHACLTSQHKEVEEAQWLRLLELHGHRIRELSFGMTFSNVHHVSEWLQRTPNLCSLALYYYRNQEEAPLEFEVTGLPDRLGAPVLAHLTSLSLDGVVLLMPEDHVYQNLTDLTLSNIALNPYDNVTNLATVLSIANKLERLSIQDAVTRELAGIPPQIRALPDTLRLLEFAGSHESHFYLLKHYTLSALTRVKITCTEPPDIWAAKIHIENALRRFMCAENYPVKASLHVSKAPLGPFESSSCTARLEFWTTSEDADAHCPPDVQYDLFIDENDALEDFLAVSMFKYLQRLSVHVDAEYCLFINWNYDLDSWAPRLRHLDVLLHPTVEPHLSTEIWYFFQWLYRLMIDGRGLDTLTVSTEMAAAMDKLDAPSQSPDTLSEEDSASPTLLPSIDSEWKSVASRICIIPLN